MQISVESGNFEGQDGAELLCTKARTLDLTDDAAPPEDDDSTAEQRRHVVVLLDAGSTSSDALCKMIAAGVVDTEDEDDTRYRCMDPVAKAPVLLLRVPRLCESLTPEEDEAQILPLQREAAMCPFLKLVLVVEYAMIQMGPSGAVLLLERAAGMLRDVGRFGAALGLVCAKVPDRGEDEDVKSEVVSFLAATLRGLQDGTLGRHLEPSWRARCAAVVSCLVGGGEDRVALLRCPAGVPAGHADDDVRRLLWTATSWEHVLPDDVGRTLPLWVRPNIARRVFLLQEAVSTEVSKAAAVAEAHVQDLLREAKADEGPALLRQLWEGGDGWCCGNVAAVRDAVDEVHRLLGELKRLQIVIEDDVLSASEELVNRSKGAVDGLVRSWALFFQFLTELGEHLWGYEVQSRRRAYDVRDVEEWRQEKGGVGGRLVVTAENVHSFFRLLAKRSGISAWTAMAGMKVQPLMLERLNNLLDQALRHEVTVARRGNELVVTGVCVVLSDVLPRIVKELRPATQSRSEEAIKVTEIASWAPSAPSAPPAPTGVLLLVQDTVFLDREWDAGHLKLAVVAPHWHVVVTDDDHLGHPTILLNGASPTPFKTPADAGRDASVPVEQETSDADANLQPSRNGACGTPGLAGAAGQPAGAFFGVAMKITDGHLLTVSAIGGDGANGQDGGDGGDGEYGRDAVSGYFTPHTASGLGEVTSVVTLAYNLRSRKFYGSSGGKGGKGGDGGAGGAAGRAGEVVLLSPRSSLQEQGVHLVANDGKPGAAGKGGKGGKGGRNGRNCTGRFHFVLFVPVADTMTPDGGPNTLAQGGDWGEPGASHRRRPGDACDAEPGEAFEEEEKDAVMEAFVDAFSATPPPCTLPRCRRELFEELLRHVQRGWRLQYWYAKYAKNSDRTGGAARRRSSSGSSFFTCTD